jgi:hypothetical protein
MINVNRHGFQAPEGGEAAPRAYSGDGLVPRTNIPRTASPDGSLWPAHPKPQEDELLSSWLARIAWGNCAKLHTFCDLAWKKRAIWNRDIDTSATREITDVLAQRTGTPADRAWQTTLAAYEGWAYALHNPAGTTKWVLPVGIYHRMRHKYGLQFCPKCLDEDSKPYFRRRWRLAFVTSCACHGIQLLDRCPACNSPVCFHRREIRNRHEYPDGLITRCFACDFDLRNAAPIALEPNDKSFHRSLALSLEQGWTFAPDGKQVYAHLYFDVLHQMVKLMLSGRSRDFGRIVADASGLEIPEFPIKEHVFENLDVTRRHCLLSLARWLFEAWPDRFVGLCRHHGLWSSWLLRDLEEVPFWFHDVVQKNLYVRYGAVDSEQEKKMKKYKRGTLLPAKQNAEP